MNIPVKIKKLYPDAIIPTYGTAESAGADLYAHLDAAVTIAPGETMMIKTGIACEFEPGYVGLVFPRSGLATKRGLAPANKVGVIDSDYRGEWMVGLHNHSAVPAVVEPGERIAQVIFMPFYQAAFTVVDELSDTERGAGGFGSTGKL